MNTPDSGWFNSLIQRSVV